MSLSVIVTIGGYCHYWCLLSLSVVIVTIIGYRHYHWLLSLSVVIVVQIEEEGIER